MAEQEQASSSSSSSVDATAGAPRPRWFRVQLWADVRVQALNEDEAAAKALELPNRDIDVLRSVRRAGVVEELEPAAAGAASTPKTWNESHPDFPVPQDF